MGLEIYVTFEIVITYATHLTPISILIWIFLCMFLLSIYYVRGFDGYNNYMEIVTYAG